MGILLAGSGLLLVTPADATFSGRAGRVAFVTTQSSDCGTCSPFDPTVWTVRPNGRDRRRFGFGKAPAFSPSGRWLAYQVIGDPHDLAEPMGIAIARRDGSQRRRLTRGYGGPPAWSPGGDALAFVARGRAGSEDFEKGALWTVQPFGGETRMLVGSAVDLGSHPTWSPSGLQLAFTRQQPNTGQKWVTVVNRDGTGMRELAPGKAPIWSRQGKLAFLQRGRLQVLNQGSASPRLVATGVGRFQWSPGGRLLAFARRGTLYTVPSNGGRLTPIAGRGATNPTWSPTGARLAYARHLAKGDAIQTIGLARKRSARVAMVHRGPGCEEDCSFLEYISDWQALGRSTRANH